MGNSSSRSSNTTNNEITNYSLQGTTGQNVVAGNNNTVTSTDYGSISAALGLANKSIDANGVIALRSMDQAGEMALMATSQTAAAWKDSASTTAEAWKDSASTTAEAWGGANRIIAQTSKEANEKVQEMAKAVATNGQNLIAQSNVKNLYVIAGVSAVALIAVVLISRGKK